MRVLILHSRYLSGSASGENRVVEDESKLLADAGHDVRVWAPPPEISGAMGQVRAGVSAVWSVKTARRVAAMVRAGRIEVVHVHNVFPALSPAVFRAARSAGAAVVMTLHNYRMMCLPGNFLRDGRVCEECLGHLPWAGVRHRCYRDSALGSATLAASIGLHRETGTYDRVTRFLAVSSFVRDKHIEAGIPADRIRVKPNFSWPVESRRGPGEYFLVLGRLAHEKGVDTLLRAWALPEPPGRLVIVGDGPDAEQLRHDAPAGVEFRGQVPSDEVPAILGGARALLVPSRWDEAAPRSITEAYAAGVPVLASDIGALPEAVRSGVTGELAGTEDPASWAEAARRLADDAESERLGAGAYEEWRERFSPESGREGLEAAYREAVAVSAASGADR